MPDFVAALVAAAVFCFSLIALNALTRLALPIAPAIGESGLLQIGGALVLGGLAWRRAVRGRGAEAPLPR